MKNDRKVISRVPFVKKEDIWAAADEFRAKHWPKQTIPVDIIWIVEFSLQWTFDPRTGIKADCDTDAMLASDMKTIIVDTSDFMAEDGWRATRFRFSLAHEVGHCVIHEWLFREIRELGWSGPDDWRKYLRDMPDSDHDWLEWQANEFAGRLLVPPQHLRQSIVRAAQKAETSIPDWHIPEARGYVASWICPDFDVSPQVIETRLEREGPFVGWPPHDVR